MGSQQQKLATRVWFLFFDQTHNIKNICPPELAKNNFFYATTTMPNFDIGFSIGSFFPAFFVRRSQTWSHVCKSDQIEQHKNDIIHLNAKQVKITTSVEKKNEIKLSAFHNFIRVLNEPLSFPYRRYVNTR